MMNNNNTNATANANVRLADAKFMTLEQLPAEVIVVPATDADKDSLLKVSYVADHATVALCAGRHTMPEEVKGAIFGDTLNPRVVGALEAEAFVRLKRLRFYADTVHIYVTGLTVALIAAINAAKEAGFKEIILYHYDRESGDYYPQKVA